MSSNHQAVRRRIDRNLRQIGRLLTSSNFETAKSMLQRCRINLFRIENSLSRERFACILTAIDGLLGICDRNVNNNFSYVAERIAEGKGQPKISVSREQLELFLNEGYTATKIAKCLGCSTALIYKICYAKGLHFRDKYATINDDELKAKIEEIHHRFPNAGSIMMDGFLQAEGVKVQRKRIRHILTEVDPIGTAVRWGTTVQRRVYCVPTPNSLWHIDAHLKLVRWGFVTHGCIDGYSRIIIYVKCTTAITADTVINLFVPAIAKYGLPSRVRSDHGYENLFVAVLMNALRGIGRTSHITGTSVHNQRIERLWRDVFQQTINLFYREFYELEFEGFLDPSNDIHRFVLHYIYTDEINMALSSFVNAWNKHKMRSENRRSPREIWLSGMLKSINSNHTSVQELFQDVPNIYQRVREGLVRLGARLNEQTIHTEHASALSSKYIPSRRQLASLENILETNVSRQDKYKMGVNVLDSQ